MAVFVALRVPLKVLLFWRTQTSPVYLWLSLQTSGLWQEFPHLPKEMRRSPKWYEKDKWASTPRRQGLLEVVLCHLCTALCRKEAFCFVFSPDGRFLLTKCSAPKGEDILPPPGCLLRYKKMLPKVKMNLDTSESISDYWCNNFEWLA